MIPGDEVGGAGAGGGEADAGAPGDARVTVGGVCGSLFVADQDVLDVGVLAELVIERQNNAAGVAEEDIDALRTEAFHQDFSAGESHAGSFRVLVAAGDTGNAGLWDRRGAPSRRSTADQPPARGAEPLGTVTSALIVLMDVLPRMVNRL